MHIHSIKKTLLFIINFLKKTSFNHKKKLLTLVILTILYHIAKRKLQLQHILSLFQTAAKLISYLPLPTFPTYRSTNQYSPLSLPPIAQLLPLFRIQSLKQRLKLKQSTWDQFKQSVLTSMIMTLVMYNLQGFYFVVQNKYQQEFKDLKAVEKFEELMGDIRKKVGKQINNIKQTLFDILKQQIKQVNVRNSYTFQQYCHIINNMVNKVFTLKYHIQKQQNQLLINNIYRSQTYFKKAQNYFLTQYQYMDRKPSKLSKIFKSITQLTSKLSFTIFPKISCQLTPQRYSLSKTAYKIPFKKSIKHIQWPNKQSQILSKLVLNQIQQIISSTNFSILLYKNAQLNCHIIQNRLFLYFQKSKIENLRMAQGLTILYNIVKEEILFNKIQQKREKFYENEILKSIKQKAKHQQQNINNQKQLLIKSQQQQNQQTITSNLINPQIFIRTMHLQQIYQSNQFDHLVKQFQIKYFNQRSKIVLNPMPIASNQSAASEEEDQMKKLLNMLGDSKELMKKQQ